MLGRYRVFKMTAITIYILTLLVLATMSCCKDNTPKDKENKTTISETITDNDYKIINSTFIHLVLTPPPGATREFGYDNYDYKDRQISDELIRDVFLTNYLVSLNDTLIFYPKPRSNLVIEDSTFYTLYKKLISDKRKDLKIEFDSITNTGLWQITPFNKGQIIKNEIEERIVTYSRIVYNYDKSKAVFYFQNDCSGLCSFGKFILVEKVDGIWKIIEEHYDWVS